MTAGQDATSQYVTGQMRPGMPALLAAFQTESDAVALTAADVAYGPHPRQVFDVVQSPLPWRGTLAYFHAGYWQSRDKSQFRFLANAFWTHGIDVALVNYPLCPDVTLPALAEAARAAVPALLAHALAAGRGGTALVIAGHSAGAHIAAELALHDWRAPSPVSALAALSGIYDLEPLIETPLNERLLLDRPTARAMSPLSRVRAGLPPALFTVGGLETVAFQAQTSAMHHAWTEAGNFSECLVVDAADHFSLLASPPLHRAVMALFPPA